MERTFKVRNPHPSAVYVRVEVDGGGSAWLEADPPRAHLEAGATLAVLVRARPGLFPRRGVVRVHAGSEVHEVLIAVPSGLWGTLAKPEFVAALAAGLLLLVGLSGAGAMWWLLRAPVTGRSGPPTPPPAPAEAGAPGRAGGPDGRN